MDKNFLRSARKAKGYTQSYVASKVGISRAGYTNIENGKKHPSVKVAKRIGKVLEIDWTKFFDNKA